MAASVHSVKQVERTIGQQIEYQLKTFGSFIVWIGHMVVASGHVEEVGHPDYFIFSTGGRRQIAEIAFVRAVHSYNYVEIIEVGHSHLPAPVGKVQAAAASVSTHTAVRQIADVIVACACRVDHPVIHSSVFAHNFVHHPFGGGAAAYIAQTHEKYFYRLADWWQLRQICIRFYHCSYAVGMVSF